MTHTIPQQYCFRCQSLNYKSRPVNTRCKTITLRSGVIALRRHAPTLHCVAGHILNAFLSSTRYSCRAGRVVQARVSHIRFNFMRCRITTCFRGRSPTLHDFKHAERHPTVSETCPTVRRLLSSLPPLSKSGKVPFMSPVSKGLPPSPSEALPCEE